MISANEILYLQLIAAPLHGTTFPIYIQSVHTERGDFTRTIEEAEEYDYSGLIIKKWLMQTTALIVIKN